MKLVLRFRFLVCSFPMKSVNVCCPFLYLNERKMKNALNIGQKEASDLIGSFIDCVLGSEIVKKFHSLGCYLCSASFIQCSKTGLIFWALLGVMSNFSNLKIRNDPVCRNYQSKREFVCGRIA